MMTHGWTLRKLAVLSADSTERAWGFTLTEVMVTLVILSVGLLGIASQSISVIKANSLSDQMTRATVLAKDKMEELKRLGYAHDQLNDTTSSNNPPPGARTDPQTDPNLFTNPDHSDTNPTGAAGTVTLTSLKPSPRPTPNLVWNVANNTPATGMKTVTIIVGWKTSNKAGVAAKAHYVALTTIMHEYQ